MRAARPRREILRAAEAVCTERGCAAARLEEVAARVGMRRASMVDRFESKGHLDHGVLQRVFGDLAQQYAVAVAAAGTSAARIERVIRTWVHYGGTRSPNQGGQDE